MTSLRIEISREQLRALVAPVVLWHRLLQALALLTFLLLCAAVVTLFVWSSIAEQWNLTVPSQWKAGLSDAEFVASACLLSGVIVMLGGMYPAAVLRNLTWRNVPRRFYELVMNAASEAMARQQVVREREALVRRGVSEREADRHIHAMMAQRVRDETPRLAGEDNSVPGLLFMLPILLILLIVSVFSGGGRR